MIKGFEVGRTLKREKLCFICLILECSSTHLFIINQFNISSYQKVINKLVIWIINSMQHPKGKSYNYIPFIDGLNVVQLLVHLIMLKIKLLHKSYCVGISYSIFQTFLCHQFEHVCSNNNFICSHFVKSLKLIIWTLSKWRPILG